jgi:hypothetical protein
VLSDTSISVEEELAATPIKIEIKRIKKSPAMTPKKLEKNTFMINF